MKKPIFIKFALLCLLGFHACEAAFEHALKHMGAGLIKRPVHIATRDISFLTRFFGGIDGQHGHLQMQHTRFNNCPIFFSQDLKVLDQLKAFTALPQTTETRLFWIGPRTGSATHLAITAANEFAAQKKSVLFLTSYMHNYFQSKSSPSDSIFPENHLKYFNGYDAVVISGIGYYYDWFDARLSYPNKVYLTHLLRDSKNTKIIISSGQHYEDILSELVTDGYVVPQDKNSLKRLLYNKS